MKLRIALIVALLCSPAFAATHYVWCGAAGSATGVNFTNAFTDLPVSLTRGDTYAVAGSGTCTYGTHDFTDTASGTVVITIRHASSSLDSGVTGYQASFASSQARWISALTSGPLWRAETSYYVFDGNPDADTGEATTSCGTSCGFYLHNAANPVSPGFWFFYVNAAGNTVSNLTFRHIEIDGTGAVMGVNGGDAQVGFYKNQGTSTNWIIDHTYIHDIAGGPFQLVGSDGFVIQNSYIARDGSNANNHGDAVSCTTDTNMTVSYNVWIDMIGTGGIVCVGGTGTNSSINIFGNIFWQQNHSFGMGNGIVSCEDSQICAFNVLNNTIYNFTLGASRVDMGGAGAGSTVNVYNNLWHNSGGVNSTTGTGYVVDYNCYESTTDASNPTEAHPCTGTTNYFVNAAGGDFHLSSDSSGGFSTHSLLPANDIDPDGLSRTLTWSRGAYQFSSATPVVAPAASMFAESHGFLLPFLRWMR